MQSLKFSQFGADNGRVVIYFHGAPGAPEECAMFDHYGKEHGLRFICFDRFAIDASIAGEAYYPFLAAAILKQAAGGKVDVIGFSIGAFIALQTCRYLPDRVRTLHLVSAAAPLEAGDFLNAMAGKQVFQLAKAFPVLFVLLSYWQSLLALLSPPALFRLLFANVAGDDKALAALLRANGVPAGLCYQRLTVAADGSPYCLHGLNAVYLKQHGLFSFPSLALYEEYRTQSLQDPECQAAY